MPSRNEYPSAPVPAAGAVIFRVGDVLLVKRGAAPNRGRWSLPGGALEPRETVEAAAVREVLEETALEVRAVRVADVRDLIERDADGRVRWHYVLVDVLCGYVRGEPRPASDADDARFVPLRELGDYDVTPSALETIERATRLRSA
ncbi:MAG: NUDIX hydrolase [Methanobacteriota archaeon]